MSGQETTPSSKAAAAPATIRLVNFISEDQLDEVKRTRGERVEDGTAQRDKPLFQILQENKEKKDAEFNERFKHRGNMNSRWPMKKRNNCAVSMRLWLPDPILSMNLRLLQSLDQRPKPPTKRSQPALLKNVIISVKPQAKKAKVDAEAKPAPEEQQPSNGHDADQKPPSDATKATLGSLVAYDDDESGDDQD
ncbi:uncharacterized protein LOC120706772 isoform X3 [Panicum virgatum]|uniref:uncharacterized protein LOC120706772 isoform X3 n=1 Tax=Panicum virgatum TaxID=38727 RepID=UPI0019D64F1C|nr:uncharacterized protein LOC120706772 isoform X3 [Panicum virgatum]